VGTAVSERCLSVREVAEYLGVSEKLVRAEIERGRLPAYRVGRVYRVRESALDALAHESAPSTDRPRTARARPIKGEFARLVRQM